MCNLHNVMCDLPKGKCFQCGHIWSCPAGSSGPAHPGTALRSMALHKKVPAERWLNSFRVQCCLAQFGADIFCPLLGIASAVYVADMCYRALLGALSWWLECALAHCCRSSVPSAVKLGTMCVCWLACHFVLDAAGHVVLLECACVASIDQGIA